MRSGYEFGEYGRLTARPDRDPEHVLANFLSKIADTAAPQLSPAARSRLLDTLRSAIRSGPRTAWTSAPTTGS